MFVITTKGKDFALALLDTFGIHIPEGRVFGLGTGPKVRLGPDRPASPPTFCPDSARGIGPVQLESGGLGRRGSCTAC